MEAGGSGLCDEKGNGTLIEAWASLKSVKARGTPASPPDDPGNPTVDFHGEQRSHSTHVSTTDPDARLFRKAKGHEAKVVYQGRAPMENGHGLAAPVFTASDRGVHFGPI